MTYKNRTLTNSICFFSTSKMLMLTFFFPIISNGVVKSVQNILFVSQSVKIKQHREGPLASTSWVTYVIVKKTKNIQVVYNKMEFIINLNFTMFINILQVYLQSEVLIYYISPDIVLLFLKYNLKNPVSLWYILDYCFKNNVLKTETTSLVCFLHSGLITWNVFVENFHD